MCQPAFDARRKVDDLEANPCSFTPNFLAYHTSNTVTFGFELLRNAKQDCRLSNAWAASYQKQPLHARSQVSNFFGNGF
jgi:hypothetical protein